MAHQLIVEAESEQGVTFRCTTCGVVCEFVKPAYGNPNPAPDGAGGWLPPENPEMWMGPCT